MKTVGTIKVMARRDAGQIKKLTSVCEESQRERAKISEGEEMFRKKSNQEFSRIKGGCGRFNGNGPQIVSSPSTDSQLGQVTCVH